MERSFVEASTAYDSLAARYNKLLENPIIAHSARTSLSLVTKAMASSTLLLEIGAGVGRETLELAALGKRIVACDPSGESLRLLGEEAARRGLSKQIQTRALSALHVRELVSEFGLHAFDGSYSSFALHYEPTLHGVPESIWTLLRPRAPLLFSILNRLCLSELVTLAPFFLPRRGLGRLVGSVELSVNQFRVLAKTYRPREILELFDNYFTLEGAWALPVIIPPHYLHRLFSIAGGFRAALEDLDCRASSRWPLKYLGSNTAYLFRSRR